MKNIAICYNEHAIKVSDSYCSGGGSSKQGNSSHSIAAPSIQNAITCIYKVDQYTAKKKKKQYFLIRLTWCSTLLKKGFSIAICENAFSDSKLFSKTFTAVRKEYGQETFESSTLIMDVFWDLRVAKYGSGPEPVAGFYVVVLANSEVSLILGDMEQEILEIKKRVLETRVSRFTLVSRIERFSGNNNKNNYMGVYATRAKFSETGNWHEILIKCRGNNYQDIEMCVCIDKKSVIEVKRLGWNFRGNGTVFVDGLLVDFMWNVHDWLFCPTTTKGYAVFLFRTRSGADSRLWLEEKVNFDEKQLINDDEQEQKVGFSFLICACKNNPD